MRIILVCLILAAGTVNADQQPSNEALGAAIGNDLSPYWRIEDVQVISTTNRGDEVEPIIAQRFEASISPSEDLYAPQDTGVDSLAPFTGLVPTIGGSDERTLYGISEATLNAGQWDIAVSLENSPEQWGQPRSMFASPTIVIGSAEQSDFMERLKAFDQAALKEELATQRQSLRMAHQNKKRELEEKHAEQLERLNSQHEQRVRELKATIQKKEQSLEARLAEIEEAHKLELAAKKKKLQQTREAINLVVELEEKRDNLVTAEERSITAEQERIDGLLSTFRNAWSDEDQGKRLAALKKAMDSNSDVIRSEAAQTGLNDENEMVRRAILASALNDESLEVHRYALMSIVRDEKQIGFRYQRDDRESDKGTNMLSITSLSPKSIEGNRATDSGGEWKINSMSVSGRGITWTDERCGGHLELEDAGRLKGKMSCGQRKFTIQGSVL